MGLAALSCLYTSVTLSQQFFSISKKLKGHTILGADLVTLTHINPSILLVNNWRIPHATRLTICLCNKDNET